MVTAIGRWLWQGDFHMMPIHFIIEHRTDASSAKGEQTLADTCKEAETAHTGTDETLLRGESITLLEFSISSIKTKPKDMSKAIQVCSLSYLED